MNGTPVPVPLGIPDPMSALSTLVDIVTILHNRPGRCHHNAIHIAEAIDEANRLSMPPHQHVGVVNVVFALDFHDAGDNLRDSLELARIILTSLDLEWTDYDIGEVLRLIAVIDGHDPDPDDVTGCIGSDADLWILSSPPQRYDVYTNRVRLEYPDLSDEDWIVGRSRVMEGFLTAARNGSLYRAGTPEDRARRHAAASANISMELERLDAAR